MFQMLGRGQMAYLYPCAPPYWHGSARQPGQCSLGLLWSPWRLLPCSVPCHQFVSDFWLRHLCSGTTAYLLLPIACVFVGLLQLFFFHPAQVGTSAPVRGTLPLFLRLPHLRSPAVGGRPACRRAKLMLGVWVGEGGQGMCFEYWTRRWHLQSQPCCFLHTSAIRTSSKPIKNQTNSMNIQWPRILIIVMNINGIGLALSTFSPVLFLPCSLSLFFHLAGSKDGS